MPQFLQPRLVSVMSDESTFQRLHSRDLCALELGLLSEHTLLTRCRHRRHLCLEFRDGPVRLGSIVLKCLL